MSEKKIKFVQINLQHGKTPTNHLNKKLHEFDDSFISIIQEPWDNNKKVLGYTGVGTLYYGKDAKYKVLSLHK